MPINPIKGATDMPPVLEKTKFKSDIETSASEKNMRLATLLETTWNDLDVVIIERIEIGSTKGWRVTYRE
jgi:hypothetical protein